MEHDIICSICLEIFILPVVLNCSHVFCNYCVCKWRKSSNTCPLCRQIIQQISPSAPMAEAVLKVNSVILLVILLLMFYSVSRFQE
ncbi:TPA_asm: oncoid [Bos-associated insect adintovirus]|uniref:Oncoid n=1 Tax=Bos-associated insect adintovirus TaxID=2597806 RepID=A0A5H3CM14_9VIRU|nr:TPA_asm: oncoid [Bos-associated insect adintovirus]